MSTMRSETYAGCWTHTDGSGNVTIVERDESGYFVPGFYGEGEPRFRTLADVQRFIDRVQDAVMLPLNWREF